jgi:uncharacterized damage-inducible protein DinB
MPRLQITPTEIEKHLKQLTSTPSRIAACTAHLSDEQLHAKPGPREWSVSEILAHLRACDEVWTHSIYAMLVEDHPELPPLDERRWAKVVRYADREFAAMLQAFALRRAELVSVLSALSTDGWSRTANIAGRSHSVFSQARRLALHEAEHCAQLEELLEAK